MDAPQDYHYEDQYKILDTEVTPITKVTLPWGRWTDSLSVSNKTYQGDAAISLAAPSRIALSLLLIHHDQSIVYLYFIVGLGDWLPKW